MKTASPLRWGVFHGKIVIATTVVNCYDEANVEKALLLRLAHGLFVAHFFICTTYLYYAVAVERYDLLLLVGVLSLGIEGILVFELFFAKEGGKTGDSSFCSHNPYSCCLAAD